MTQRVYVLERRDLPLFPFFSHPFGWLLGMESSARGIPQVNPKQSCVHMVGKVRVPLAGCAPWNSHSDSQFIKHN